METKEFITYLSRQGVDASPLAHSRPKLISILAENWSWTHIFRRILDRAFIGDLDGKRVEENEMVILRQITHVHWIFRTGLSRRAPTETLQRLGEDRVSTIERDQMPVTADMSKLLKEIQILLAVDNLSALSLLNRHAINVNQKDRDGLTPCAIAAQSGSIESLVALCRNGANPHVRDSMGNAPLHWACSMNHLKILNVLLYHGANPNASSRNGVTPLMLALSKSNKWAAQKLFEYGADLQMKDRYGNSVLHRAVIAKNAEMVSFFVESGALTDDPNSDGATPMALAMRVPALAVLFQNA